MAFSVSSGLAFLVFLAAVLYRFYQHNEQELGIIRRDLHDIDRKLREVTLRQEKPASTNNVDVRPIALINGRSLKPDDPAHLLHVDAVFRRLGYRTVLGLEAWKKESRPFSALWNHEYPFMNAQLRPLVESPLPDQVINHIPGSGYYTSKVSLATANLSLGVPLAFALPGQKDAFLRHAKENPRVRWVQKSNAHREIKIVPTDKVQVDRADSFVQLFVENPLLIDQKKFDIGIYTVVTSISPLRVYIFEGDVLLRFCAEEYEPFDAANVDKYVVGDDYTPVWEMPSLKELFVDADLTFKESLNVYLKSQGKDASVIWSQIREIIRQVFESQNAQMKAAGAGYIDQKSYFELSRFDFVVDADLTVFLMEANMSPNLSSGHFSQNRLLYEQVIFNVLSLVGVARRVHIDSGAVESRLSREMRVSRKDLAVPLSECITQACATCPKNSRSLCRLCSHCWSAKFAEMLEQTFLEHVNRRQMRRILPRTTTEDHELSDDDYLLRTWLRLKCDQNRHFCE